MALFDISDVGIDLGTSTTLVYVRGRGIVLTEPSIVAVEKVTGRIVAIGEEARQLVGRAPAGITLIRPLRDGVVSNFDITARMLRYFFEKVVGKRMFRPRVIVCVPSGVTEAEKRCAIEAAYEAGARYCYLIDEPLAAAIGAEMDIFDPSGCMVVDIGGGTTDLAIISSGCILLSDSIRMAGDKFNETLMAYMKYKHGLNIGERNAEDIKVTYGRAHADTDQRVIDIRGRDAATGSPESVPLGTNEIADALYPALSCIVASIRDLLSRIPAPMVESIQKKGIMLTGGGALLEGLPALITEQSECACRVAEDPLGCVARGTGIVLEDLNGYRNAIYDYRRGEYYEG